MFPYRDKYTESVNDIQNNYLLYKIHQTCQNTFEIRKSKSTVYPPKTDTHRRLRTRNRILEPARIFYIKKNSFLIFTIYIYIYIYIYWFALFFIYVYFYIYIYMFIYLYMFIYTFLYIYIFIYIYINILICKFINLLLY